MRKFKLFFAVILVFTLSFCIISCKNKEVESAETEENFKNIETLDTSKDADPEEETEKEPEDTEEEETEETEETEEETEEINRDVSYLSGTWMTEKGGFLMVDDEGNWMYTDGTDTTIDGNFSVAENGKLLAHFNSKTHSATVGAENDLTIEDLGKFIKL